MMIAEEMQMWIVLGVMALLVVGLVTDKFRPHNLFFGATLILMLLGILDYKVFLTSFANGSIATIFVLILITAGVNSNFNILKYLDKIFTQQQKPRWFLFQMMGMVSLISSVMNNTPIVAMMIPYVMRWSKKMKIPPAKLLIPLSFAAISGGMITVIGTSTNLVLNGFMESKGVEGFKIFDFVIPGILVTLAMIFFLITAGYNLLTARKNPIDFVKENLKEYLVEVSLSQNSAQIGKTVQEAGLRNLQRVYLVEIDRGGKLISPVAPEEVLESTDRLFFAGDTTGIVEIVKEKNGFEFPKTQRFNLQGQLEIIETLIPYNSHLSGKTLREAGFREKYDAAVIAIHRNSERLRGKLGEVRLSHGDLLMLTAGRKFQKALENNTDLYSLGIKDQLGKTPRWKATTLGVIAVFMMSLVIAGFIPFFIGILTILITFLGLGLMSQKEVSKNLNLDLFIILGSAVALGSAFIETGGAKFIADEVIHVFSAYGNISLVIGIYLLTVILTAFITNAAAVSIVFPIAYEMNQALNIEASAIYLAIAFGASCCFTTPFGYQTNLMVYAPGGYKFIDFIKIGIPVTIIYSVVSLSYILIHYQMYSS
ncbi:Na(+)/dicarboxylate symporter [Candidatus Ornithobacterium hominis]|uniref:SLC13 family permease n=1 Tax=Candidatus Ornithobacterium hominis TaxID=2497989 RepID=UPI0024BC63BC|nr:SLC13 family permease [Candidatus Ornithobacterium hominis]CAI9430282.1 Na(+)/dicarboxylate symporter [Candidatus Ornithobacterium hominis]